MQKIGKEASTGRPPVASPVPTKQINGDASLVGATPLSSSSLSNMYPTANGTDGGESDGAYEGGGIMSFIFRGGRPAKATAASNGPPMVVHLPQVPDSMRQGDAPPSERERVEMEIIKSLIESYFSIVLKNFIDMVPKTIMYFLVNHVRDAMQNELVSELYRDAEMGNLMQEAEDIAQKRATCEEMRDLLGKALEIVNEVRDFNTFK